MSTWPRPEMMRHAWLVVVFTLMALLVGCGQSTVGSLVITSPTDGSSVSTSTVTVHGTAPANVEVVHDIPLASDTRTTAGSDGSWSIPVELDTGSNVLTFRIGDDASTAKSVTVTFTGSAGATEGAEPSGATEPTTAPAATFKAITLKGKGKKVAKFTIPADAAAIAQATHSGKSNFSITSIAADGKDNDLLVNTIGKYKGTILFDTGDGEHSVAFKVDADGSWVIVIKPVTSARAWNGTSLLKGTGDDVIQISPASSGLVTLDLAFKGSGNFAVVAYSPTGSDLLANEIANFTGQVLLPDGSILLAVTADGGTWSVKPG